MQAHLKQAWIQRCAQRLVELEPLLRPRVAGLVAEELWRDERGHIPPEEWAELEVNAWKCRQPKPVRAKTPKHQ